MFSDWPSELLPQNGGGDEFSISAFKDTIPWNVGRDFVAGTAKHLYECLGLNVPKPPSKSKIVHAKQLQILMPAIGFGLSFPLNEHEILRNCVYVYNEWLSALLPEPKGSVPLPILKDPNHYARIIITHFYYLFVPRTSQAVDEINRQALLCHRVLRTLQEIAKSSPCLTEDTWQTLLLFLLHINSALLSPPAVKNDAGEQLGERVLSVLFETWLLACARCFPPPPLWNALRESCQKWRHRTGLVEQWNRINAALTAKLLGFMYGPGFCNLKIPDDDLNIIPSTMSRDCIAQVWFRILHIIGDPVDLSQQHVISKTPAFLKYAITSDLVIEPYQHPCLANLPFIFVTAMKGVSTLVDAFLGTSGGSTSTKDWMEKREEASSGELPPVKGRPKCNSILHLFGPWLFEAALINCNLSLYKSSTDSSGARRPASTYTSDHRKSSAGESASFESSSANSSYQSSTRNFQSGRAEALGALCRIFCSKKSGEEILPVYLARFYIALKEGLQLQEESAVLHSDDSRKSQNVYKRVVCSETAASILLNGTDLFRLDLDGVCTLVPSIVPVLSHILMEQKDPHISGRGTAAFATGHESGTDVHLLRRAATHILLSLLPLPLHFQGLGIKEIGALGVERVRLNQLRPQLVHLLSGALQLETDATNIQMLLAGLVFCVQDASLCESVDSVSQHDASYDTTASYAASDTSLGCMDYSLSDDNVAPDATDGAGANIPALPRNLIGPANFVLPHELTEELAQIDTSDTAHGLYVRSIYLVSHCLMSSWTKDVNVSLAGLELLSSLAVMNFREEQDTRECKCAVKWLCGYIVSQCSRPPQAHSKDLHSMIVAAFNCLCAWVVSHPYLLDEKDTLNTVLEVIELGISGTKSQTKGPGEPPRLKQEKELMPVSMRVRDAAEALLSSILSQVGNFPPSCGVESLSSLLDESTLLSHCNSFGGEAVPKKEAALKHFKYFVTQNSILMGLLEQPLVNHEEPQPTVTCLIRGPSGRSAWNLHLRHLPRYKATARQNSVNPGRPLPINDAGKAPQKLRPAKYFPDSVDRIPMCKADKSIPTLEQVIQSDEKSVSEHEKMLQILEHQIAFENKSATEKSSVNADDSSSPTFPDSELECSAPQLCIEFQTARLMLSHFGLLSVEALQENPSSLVPSLIALDPSSGGSNWGPFAKDLDSLDRCSNRTLDSVYVFYVKTGQLDASQIMSNANTDNLPPVFLEFLYGLGWKVDVGSHPGWTGNLATAFKTLQQSASSTSLDDHSLLDGRKEILYWADSLSELAFILPSTSGEDSKNSSHQLGASLETSSERSDSFSHPDDPEGCSLSSQTSHASGAEQRTSNRRFGRQASLYTCSSHKVQVAWMESIDDAAAFPKMELFSASLTGLEPSNWKEKDISVHTIFIHPLTNGLFKISLEGQHGKLSLAGPLVDGQVVSRRVLGTLVRQTALNMCRRRRLESDTFHPPHVRRKFKIQEMVQKYRSEMNESEFYTHLFF